MTMSSTSVQPPDETPTSPLSKRLRQWISPLYRLFDWIYGSGYNPLYRSGTLAVGFLFILLVTGLYLSLCYSVSQPYESVAQIQSQAWLGRWVRALHRYATVATIIAILFHILQLLAQGKSWGPRTLAWISGVLLTFMFFVSAWSGYVMVWDAHGQRVALAGAKMLGVFPFLRDVVGAAFNGTAPIPPGFFFMNLFLHVAVPVAMILFLWVHTARLSRAVWFPIKRVMIWSSVAFLALALLWPAALLEKADLLKIVGRIPTDYSTGFWIAWLESFGPWATWGIILLPIAALTAVPWWWRPKPEAQRPISRVDGALCTGCVQCTRDCPYEAIKMVPRPDGKRLIAEIIPNHCVSCGICAASCADFAIGPPGRTAADQRERVRAFCDSLRAGGSGTELVMVACVNNSRLLDVLNDLTDAHQRSVVYPVECCGCMHSEVLEQLLGVSKGVALIGCPARNCFNRDGGDLLAQRIFEKRVPFLDRSVDRNRLLITTFSEAESPRVRESVEIFRARLCDRSPAIVPASGWPQRIRALVVSAGILCLCAFASQAPMGTEPSHAFVRVAGLLPSSVAEKCRVPTEAELASIPMHMRPKEICEKTLLIYRIRVRIDSQLVLDTEVKESAGRTDRPIFLDLETLVQPGERDVHVAVESAGRMAVECSSRVHLNSGRIFLAHYRPDEEAMRCT